MVRVRMWYGVLAAMVAAVLVAGCGSAGEPEVAADAGSGDEVSTETYTSEILGTDYEGALAASGQLALGTLLLAETDDSVTPDQANTLLPLWQALQGGVTATAEVDTVLKQIERTMTSRQLEAIAAMQLTQEGMGEWTREQGVGFAGGGQGEVSEEELATRQAERAEGGGGFGGGQGGDGREVSPEMATRQAEFGDRSDEEREALRATMQAGGNPFGEGEGRPGGAAGPWSARGSAGARQYMVLLQPLIEMLEELTGA